MKRAEPQAATKLVSQAGKNVSRQTRKPAQLKAFSFQNGQYQATKTVRLSNSFRDGQDLPCRQSRQCAGGIHVELMQCHGRHAGRHKEVFINRRFEHHCTVLIFRALMPIASS